MDTSSIELLAHLRLAETGLTAAELLSMDMAEYARVTGRPTGSQPPAPQPQETAGTPEPEGIDVSSLDMDQYSALRGQLGMGVSRAEGRGIFDSVGSQSAEYRAATRAQAGRTAWTTSNVVESPRLPRVFLNPDEQRDTRTVAERFSFPGSAWQG